MKVIEKWLKNVVKLDEMQIGFMLERETVNAIFILRQMLV